MIAAETIFIAVVHDMAFKIVLGIFWSITLIEQYLDIFSIQHPTLSISVTSNYKFTSITCVKKFRNFTLFPTFHS